MFFSPPYYRLELYDSDNQSTHKYKSYESWLINYWEKTVNLCAQVLQDNGKMCYILSGYGSHNTQSFIDLITDMNNITKKYFTYLKTLNMQNKNVHVTNHRETEGTYHHFSQKITIISNFHNNREYHISQNVLL